MADMRPYFWFVLLDPTDFTAIAHAFDSAQVKRGTRPVCAGAIAESDGRGYQALDAAIAASRIAAVQECPRCSVLARC